MTTQPTPEQDGVSSTPSQPAPGQDLWARASSSGQPSPAQPSAPGWERDVLERLVFATVNEQRAARRWRIFWRFFWTLLIVAGLWWLGRDSASSSMSGPHTAVVNIKGPIASDANANAEFVIAAMRSAMEDPGSRALVLLINSPGGSPVQAGMINDEIVRLKAQYQKPIYAVVEETCAAAAYYIAAAVDEIFVDKASIVGSIGVLMDGFGFT
ncbi:MAG: S49 family peptidase, partial [Comamonas sp.]|nr:S49 family peptidase [Candidatus Comamonas equi]